MAASYYSTPSAMSTTSETDDDRTSSYLSTLDDDEDVGSEPNSWYRYCPQQSVDNPLRFWIEKSKAQAGNPFPALTKLALDIFSIPAMSAECEHVFSQTKRVITDDRNCLSATTIEAV